MKSTHALLATSAILSMLGLAACGGGSTDVDAPTDASVEDFCGAYVSLFTEGDVEAIKGEDITSWGEELEQVGTPEELSEDERAGFEILVSFAGDVDADADLADIEDPDVSDDEQEQLDAFISYTATACTDQMMELGG